MSICSPRSSPLVLAALLSLTACGGADCLRKSDCDSSFECREGACVAAGGKSPSTGAGTGGANAGRAGSSGSGGALTAGRGGAGGASSGGASAGGRAGRGGASGSTGDGGGLDAGGASDTP